MFSKISNNIKNSRFNYLVTSKHNFFAIFFFTYFNSRKYSAFSPALIWIYYNKCCQDSIINTRSNFNTFNLVDKHYICYFLPPFFYVIILCFNLKYKIPYLHKHIKNNENEMGVMVKNQNIARLFPSTLQISLFFWVWTHLPSEIWRVSNRPNLVVANLVKKNQNKIDQL